eukprot:214273-Hanusia_phi.AAC.1
MQDPGALHIFIAHEEALALRPTPAQHGRQNHPPPVPHPHRRAHGVHHKDDVARDRPSAPVQPDNSHVCSLLLLPSEPLLQLLLQVLTVAEVFVPHPLDRYAGEARNNILQSLTHDLCDFVLVVRQVASMEVLSDRL